MANRVTDEYRKLQPLVVSEIRAALQGLALGASGGGGVAPDLTGYLTQTAADARYLKLAGGTMAGNIAMPALGTVDSIDVSVHVADPDAHHARQHGILTAADHSIIGDAYDLIGLTGTDTLGKLVPSSNPGANAAILRTDATGLARLVKLEIGTQATATPALTFWSGNSIATNPDIEATTNMLQVAEDSMYFGIDSNASGTGAIFAWLTNARTSAGDELMRLTETGRLGIGDTTPSYELDVAGTIQGQTAVRSPALIATTDVTTPLLVTASGNLTLTPAGTAVILSDGKAYTTASFDGGFTGNGFRIDQGIARTGHTTAEVDDLVVRGRMSIYELLIRQIRATNGAVFVTSTAKVVGVSGPAAGIYTLTTDSETPHGFLVNDVIRAQRAKWDGSALVGLYQSDMIVTGSVNLYTFRATLETGTDAPEAGYEYVRLGNTANADRRGTVYLTADDTNAPYIDIVDGVASHADWNTAGKIKGRFGKLTGITSTTNEYGLFAGQGTAVTDKYIIASTQGVTLNNVDIALRSGSTQTGSIANNGTFWFGVSSTDKRLAWDGATLAISGQVTATTGNIAGWAISATQIENVAAAPWIRLISGGAGTARLEVGNSGYADRGAGIVSRSTLPGIVFYAGKDFAHIGDSPFQVNMQGDMIASQATITGSLTAGNVTITPGEAMKIAVSSSLSNDAAIRFVRGAVQEGVIGAYTGYMALIADGLLYLDGASIFVPAGCDMTVTDDVKTATTWATRFRGGATTSYLTANGGTDIISFTSTAFTSTIDLTAPGFRVASGTGYLKVGSANVVSWTASVLQTTAVLGEASWTALAYDSAFTATRTGTVYVKRFGDQVFYRGSCKSNSASGNVAALTIPNGYTRPSSTIIIYLPRSNGNLIKATIVGNSDGGGLLSFTAYTTDQDIYFDNVSLLAS